MSENTSQKSTYSRICDIGVVVKDLEKTVKRLEALGIGPFEPASPPPGAEGLYYRGKLLESNFKGLVAHLGDVEMEVFQPTGSPNPWEEFLETRGEGIHHIGFKVDDVEKEADRLTAQGAEVTMTGKVNGKLAAAYIDLKAGGLLIELIGYNNGP